MDPIIAVGIVLIFAIYLIPALIAFGRSHPNRWVILLLNVFLGGTGIVWFGCLIWAFMAVHRTRDPMGSHGGESGLNLAANDVVRVRFEPPALPPPLPSAFASTPPDLIEKLERLKKLRDDGVIDAGQFEELKRQILGKGQA